MVGTSTRLPVGRSVVRIPVQAKYLYLLQNVHTVSGAPKIASNSMGTVHLTWEYGNRGVKLTIHHLLPRLRITTAVLLTGCHCSENPLLVYRSVIFETVANQCSLTQVVGRQHKLLWQQAAARLTTRKLSRLLDTL